MKKFIVIYHAPQGFSKQEATPEDMQKGMEAWMAWAKKCGNQLIDLGSPLGGGQELNPDGSSKASSHGVAGYSVVQAEDLTAAKKLFDGHPHLAWAAGCTIEIHECMPLPGQ